MYDDASAKCPFFCTAVNTKRKRYIRCEGVVPNSNILVSFCRPKKLEKQRRDFCDCDCWQGCPVAQMIAKK